MTSCDHPGVWTDAQSGVHHCTACLAPLEKAGDQRGELPSLPSETPPLSEGDALDFARLLGVED